MRVLIFAALVWSMGFRPSIPANRAGAQTEPSVLSLRLSPVPLVRHAIPLTRALDEAGSFVQGGYTLFGVELRSPEGQEPVVSLDLRPGTRLGDALQQIIDQVPGYEFEVVSAHMINIHPSGATKDLQDPLNTFVAKFHVVQVDPATFLTLPESYIPELAARLKPETVGRPRPTTSVFVGPIGTRPKVTVHLELTTVRGILNAVAEATEEFPPKYAPLGWFCLFQPQPDAPGGGRFLWRIQWSAPRDWKQEPARRP